MKKKFFAAACAAAVMAFSATVPMTASANEYYSTVNELAGIEFGSFEKMNGYVTSLNGSSAPKDMEQKVFDYLLSADGVFVPDSVSAEDITSVFVAPTYTEVCDERSKIRLAFYHDEKAGEMEYSNAEIFAKNKEYAKAYSAKSTVINGYTVYSYEILGESYYVWKQDGNYFRLRLSGSYSSAHLSLCNAVKLGFDESGEFQTKNGKLYFVKPDGSYATGWKTVNGNKYYFCKNGEAITKSTSIDGVRYKFGKDGVCTGAYTGWTKSGGKRFYFLEGLKQKSWCKLSDGWHYFDEKSGAHTTGAAELYGKTYTFSESGVWDGNGDGYYPAYSSLNKKLSGDDFAGVYTRDGVLVVMTVNREKVAPVVEKMRETYAPIIMQDCKFSANELEAVKSHLDENYRKYSINGWGTATMSNQVSITTGRVTDELQAYIDSLDDPEIVSVDIGVIVPVSDDIAVDTIDCF